jgi:hypothetical protein
VTVRNDATRLLLRPADRRRPRAVVARQGQVLLDADLDHGTGHLLDRVETAGDDTFGSPGRLVVPAGSTGFAITAAASPADCGIGPGHGYLRGWLLENVLSSCTLATQPHPRTDTTPAAPFLLALKALVRHVDPVEEPAWTDTALGDAQASGRALLDWQVFPFAPTPPWKTAPSCATAATGPDWARMVTRSTGTLAVVPDTAPPVTDPCSLAPSGGYSRAENLLYRVEVHGGTARTNFPTADGPRFGLAGLKIKMSRRNASVMARIMTTAGAEVTVTPPPLDPLNWFAPGTYAEVVSVHDDVDAQDAAGTERLFRVAKTTDTVVTLENAAKPLLGAVGGKTRWFLRLWDAFPDGSGVATVSTANDPNLSQPIDLGDGLSVRVGAGTDAVAGTILRRGDHWTFAARADGTVDWPAGSPHETPHGPETRYAPLAVVSTSAGSPQAEDCRIPLATLTDRTLLYRGGDGQEVPVPAAGSFATLPGRLRVAVMRGQTPVTGATVRWSVPGGGPAVRVNGQSVDTVTTIDVDTGADGLCEVDWAIDAAQPGAVHQVQAELLSAAGTAEGPAVVFTAGFRTADATSYRPGACDVLAKATNVQDALDTLCVNLGGPAAPPPTLQLTSVRLADPAGNPTDLLVEDLILNGLEVPHIAFASAIGIGVSGPPLDAQPQPFDPIVEVELDLPYPTTDPDRRYWALASRPPGGGPLITGTFGFQRVRLDGDVGVIPKGDGFFDGGLLWKPSAQAFQFLESLPFHHGGFTLLDGGLKDLGWTGEPRYPRLLCRLRVRSAHVWSLDPETGGRIYLNAEHLGTVDNATRRELLVKDRDPQRAADLDMFFFLAIKS